MAGSAAALSKGLAGKGGAPRDPPLPGLRQRLGVELQMLTLRLTAPLCCPARGQIACPKPGTVAARPGDGWWSRRGWMAFPSSRRLSGRRQSGGGIAAETAVNLCGRIAACKYITGAQQVPRRIRPGERDAPGGDERIPSVEFMWNKLSTGDISS